MFRKGSYRDFAVIGYSIQYEYGCHIDNEPINSLASDSSKCDPKFECSQLGNADSSSEIEFEFPKSRSLDFEFRDQYFD